MAVKGQEKKEEWGQGGGTAISGSSGLGRKVVEGLEGPGTPGPTREARDMEDEGRRERDVVGREEQGSNREGQGEDKPKPNEDLGGMVAIA